MKLPAKTIHLERCPGWLHHALKLQAAQESVTLRALVLRLLEQAVKR